MWLEILILSGCRIHIGSNRSLYKNIEKVVYVTLVCQLSLLMQSVEFAEHFI
jgi:hypothetical protein